MHILSPNGRLNRLQYFMQSFITGFALHAAVAAYFIWAVVIARASGQSPDRLHAMTSGPQPVIIAALFLLGMLCSWILLVSQVKRLHDLNQSGWLVLINLIPGAGLIMWLILVLARGEDHTNSYSMATA